MNKHYTLKAGIAYLFLASMLFLSNSLSAQTTFGGFVNSDYSTVSNWTAGLPSAANPGTIPGGAVVNINSALTINFTLTSFGTINANAQVTLSGTLNNFAGSDFNISATGRLVNNGTMDQRGTLDIAAGGQFTSTANFSSTGSFVLNNAGTTTLSGTFSNFGTINNDGTLAVSGGTVSNNVNINNNGTLNLTAGTLANLFGANLNNAPGKTLTHNTGATLNNQGTVSNEGTYANSGAITSNGVINNIGTFNNSGSITNNFRLNNNGTFNNNTGGNIVNEFEVNNGGIFTNNAFLDNGAQIYNLATGNFTNAATGRINNQFGSTLSNANIFNNIGEIESVGDIINSATFTNGGSIYTNTGGGITNTGNFNNNSLLNNLEEIINAGIFNNNGQLQNNSGGVFTNNGDLFNAQPARISNDYNIVNNKNLVNNGTIENGVRVFNNDYFENNGYLLNIGDFVNEVTGLFYNTGTSTTTGSNGGVLENSNGGVFSNRGTLDNYNEIFNFECSSFINTGIINNYYWWTNHSLFFNYGTFNELPYHQMNMDGGVEITGPSSTQICENITVGIGDNGSVTLTGTAVAIAAYDNCSTLTLLLNGNASVTYTCADIGIKPVKLTIKDRVGTSVMCSANITIVDNTAPVFQNCPTDVVVISTGTTTPATWTAPTATDNCGPVNVTSTHTSGSGFPVGTTTVTYNAVDGKGNGAAPCTFKVIVVPPGDCAEVASVNKVASTATNCGAGTPYAMWLNNEYFTAGSDLLFIQYTNGTALLTGSVQKGSLKGYVEVNFSGRTTAAPAGSPKYELCVNSGASAWSYYPTMDGTITLDDCRLLSIKRFGPSPQMGLGGNLQDKTLQGLSAWFSVNNSTTHGGDFNFRIGDAVQCQSGVYLEAECASYGSKWQLRNDANASNGKLLLPPAQYSYDYAPTTTADLVTFNVNVTVAGSYRIFARSAVPNSDGDSYWVRVNNGTWVKWNSVNLNSYTGFNWDQVGHWNGSCNNDLPVSFNLVAGANTIQFAWREPNACLDKLFVTLSGKRPTGLGGNATNCGSNPAPTDPFDGKILCIKSRSSNKNADIFGGSNADGTKLIQWDYTGGNNQKFRFTAVGANTYTITAQHSNKCLDATATCFAGSKVVQRTCDGTNSQRWTIEAAGSGFYFIKSVSSGLYLDVSGGSTANGAEIILWGKHGGTNQQWAIENCGAAPVQCNKTALLVVGDLWLCGSDAAIKNRLQGLGYTVTVRNDFGCSTADANGRGLIVISASVNSNNVGTKYRDVNVPVISCESYLFDDMKMTGVTLGNHYGKSNSISSIRVFDSNHPIAQGATGDFAMYPHGKTINWGNPGTGASKIAVVPGNPSCAMIFTYDAGASMVGLTAPARRAGFFLDDDAEWLTSNGWLLFDRTIEWASGCDLGVNAGKDRTDVLDLQADRSDRMVNLKWQNNTGFKNQFFSIEKSTDGTNWEVLGTQDAYSNEDQSNNVFESFDLNPVIGENFYRVVVTFLDGTTKTSDTRVVTLNDIEDFGIFPNPASYSTKLNLEQMVGQKNVTIRIFDWTGREQEHLQIDEVLEADYTIDLQNLQTGRYSVQVSTEGKKPVSKKLIISK